MIESVISWAFLHRNPEVNSGIHKVKMLIDAGTYASLLLNTVAPNETTQIALLIFSGFWYAAFLIDKARITCDPFSLKTS
jgi:hypothetical protein